MSGHLWAPKSGSVAPRVERLVLVGQEVVVVLHRHMVAAAQGCQAVACGHCQHRSSNVKCSCYSPKVGERWLGSPRAGWCW